MTLAQAVAEIEAIATVPRDPDVRHRLFAALAVIRLYARSEDPPKVDQ